MDPDTDVYQTEQPQISYSFDFTAEQSRAIQSPKPIHKPNLLPVGSGVGRAEAFGGMVFAAGLLQ